jgi:hypothetical protein
MRHFIHRYKILHVLAFFATISLLIFEFALLLNYILKPDISVAYSYIYFIIYLYLPLTLLAIVLINSINWEKSRNRDLLGFFLKFNLISTILIGIFFNQDANKVLIQVENLSTETIENITIVARNKQYIELNNLAAGQEKNTYCDCRDVSFNDSIGLRLKYKIGKTQFNYDIFGSNSNLFDQSLIFRVINDTLIYRSYDSYPDTLWGRVDKYSSLDKWENIKKEYLNKSN